MGDEHRATLRHGGATSEGRALLETDELLFRGDERLRIPLRTIDSVREEDGELIVRFGGDEATFVLGPKAARWAERIRNPKSLLDKLGVKPDSRVAVLDVSDQAFLADLRARVPAYATAPEPDLDLIFLGAESVKELARIANLVASLRPNGHVWIVAPKGRKDIREADVLEAGRAAGLKDTKVARLSQTHTAHRFTIPLDAR